MLLKFRQTATRKSAKRYKNLFVTFKFFRQRYKFLAEKPNKKGIPLLVSLYSTQRYNISHRNPNYINIRLTFRCSEFAPKSSGVIALRAVSRFFLTNLR